MEKKNFRATGSDRELHKTKKVTFSSDIKGKKNFLKTSNGLRTNHKFALFFGCF